MALVNRGGSGRVPVEPLDDGFVRGDSLTTQKTRVLLSVALTTSSSASDLQRIFSEY